MINGVRMLGIPEIIITYAHHWCDTSLKVVFYQNCPYSCQWWWWFWWSDHDNQATDNDNTVKGSRVQPGAAHPFVTFLVHLVPSFIDPNFIKSVLINQSFTWIHLRKLIGCSKHLTKDMREAKSKTQNIEGYCRWINESPPEPEQCKF